MATEFRPLIEILRELKALAARQASGFFFVVTEETHSCIIRLHAGQVEEVVFRMLRNDEAVQRLSMVAAARARFQADPASHGGNARGSLSEASRQWLLGGFEHDLGAPPAPVPVAPEPASAPSPPVAQDIASGAHAPDPRQRQTIEQVALQYFGPIAGMLCDEVFDVPGELQAQLEQLAANLASPDETRRFLNDVRAALARLPA
mgnify:CR=1 FL=1